MQIKISGHHVSVSPEMESSVHDKLAKVERHFDHINSMQVIFSKENHQSPTAHREAETAKAHRG